MRTILSKTKIHPAIHQKISNFSSEIVAEVESAIQKHHIVAVGLRWNNSVK